MYSGITLVGRLGQNPELRYLPDGTGVCNMSVAVDGFDGQQKTTAWYRVSVFGRQAENCNQYLGKGSVVIVHGDLKFDSATGGPRIYDKRDGTKGASFEVKANTVRFGPKSANGDHADEGDGDLFDGTPAADPTTPSGLPF